MHPEIIHHFLILLLLNSVHCNEIYFPLYGQPPVKAYPAKACAI
jgi:hypothetical protein